MKLGYSLNLFRTPQTESPLVCHSFHQNNHCEPGYVYLIRYGDLVKIGKNSSLHGRRGVAARKRAHDKALSQKGQLIGTLHCACAVGLERWIHLAYLDKWIASELFRLSEQDLQNIKAIPEFSEQPVVFEQ